MKPRVTTCAVVTMGWLAGGLMAQHGPSFDCSAATGEVEELICDEADLAVLDRELSEAWSEAIDRLPEPDEARAFQRGWIKGRDECWKSSDVAACVRDAYETRITELQVQAGLVMVPDYTSFSCDDGTMLTATFYDNTKVPVAVLTLDGRDQVLAYPARSGSGARYEGPNVTYWEHQGEVSLTWAGEETLCRSDEDAAGV